MLAIKKNVLLLNIFFFSSFFIIFFVWPAKAWAQVQINEIAWMGTSVSAADEWIELYNSGGQTIDLAGWILFANDGSPQINLEGKILPHSYFLLERTDDNTIPNIAADQIYVGALANSGEDLFLKNAAGEIEDKINASSGWPAGDNTTKQTMVKCGQVWRSSLLAGGSPKAANDCSQSAPPICGNSIVESGEECDDGNTASGDGCNSFCQLEANNSDNDSGQPLDRQNNNKNQATSSKSYQPPQPVYTLGDVVINELVSDPADGENEWVEIYNTTNQEINIDGWRLVDGSGAQTKLSGHLGSEGKKRFLVIQNPAGYLNNQGDLIALRDNNNFLIDKVCYGAWDDGLILDNAPAAPDPFSLARRIDGYNTFNNKNDFRLTTTPTKGTNNIISLNSNEHINYSEYDYSDKIVISEIFPNPIGIDKTAEFIELYNNSQKIIDLIGWRFCDQSGACFLFSAQNAPQPANQWLIKPGQYLVFYRPLTNIALNNSGDEIKLFAPMAIAPQQTVGYSQAPEGQSYILLAQKWVWSPKPTPGQKNFLPKKNLPPAVDFSCPAKALVGQPVFFDSSDTIDKNNDQLKFSWNFGDGFKNNLPCPEHTYLQAGEFTVQLAVSDGHATSSLKKKIVIQPKNQIKVLSAVYSATSSPAPFASAIRINEFLPNPKSSQAEEWIEIKNASSGLIDLSGWQLDDSPGGSQPYQFISKTLVPKQGFLVLRRSETKIALNNNGDEVRLISPAGKVIYSINYKKAPRGYAYAFNSAEQKWQWTGQLTPGKDNVFKQNFLASIKPKNNFSSLKIKTVPQFLISNLLTLPKSTTIKTRGWAISLPGNFSKQYFYIQNKQAGIQVYNYKGQFPKFGLGDWLEIEGETSSFGNEKRIKTNLKKIKVLPLAKAKLAARAVKAVDLANLLPGQLVAVRGQVAEKEGYNVFLDDGTAEANIYLKRQTGIKPKNLNLGVWTEITGILVLAKSGRQIWPRQPADIIFLPANNDNHNIGFANQPSPLILGESASSDQWSLPAREQPNILKYWLTIAFFILISFLGWHWQRKNRP